MPRFDVVLPIAGHLLIEVEADNEHDAIEAAKKAATIDYLKSWEPMDEFNTGNVCHCPQPWEAEATLIEDD